MGCAGNQYGSFEFSPTNIGRAAGPGRLLSMEIEFSLRCNFRCPYCYVADDAVLENELGPGEIRDVIQQAKSLGAGKIIVLGGEPTIYPGIVDMVRFMGGLGLEVEIFTNGSGVTPELARFFYEEKVRVVLKMNTFDEALQDRLAGCAGAFQTIRRALESLRQAGYPDDDAFLAASTIICRQNFDELPDLWQWLCDRGIEPYFEIMTPQSRAVDNRWLEVDPATLHRLFARLAEIDRTRYGRVWEAQPPLVGNRCLRHQFSCLVTSRGEVMPCVGITLSQGNIRERPLEEILAGSRVIRDLKNHRNTIKGPCRTCEKAEQCYGCRGAAFQVTGDYLASDPLCWNNCDASLQVLCREG
ncbi:MAG: radical SAM protein [Desulfobacterales bacterium]|nr:radical SAM protein [Desulfobacterales bacterium]